MGLLTIVDIQDENAFGINYPKQKGEREWGGGGYVFLGGIRHDNTRTVTSRLAVTIDRLTFSLAPTRSLPVTSTVDVTLITAFYWCVFVHVLPREENRNLLQGNNVDLMQKKKEK